MSSTRRRRAIPAVRPLRLAPFLLLAGFVATTPVWPKIDLVTLPDRGETELTIYNSEDLTLVRERRRMSFGEGSNPLQFSWANTLIDPTSVHLEIIEGSDFLDVEDISYPANTANTLIWSIEASRAGEGTIEISYFTSGITWAADYVVVSDLGEKKLGLDGFVRVTNNSGEDYLDAKTRLIVGEINLVEKIAQLGARGGGRDLAMQEMRATQKLAGRMERANMMMADGMVAPSAAAMPAAPKEVAKEGVSEYFLFTIEGREDLEDKLSKRLPSFDVAEVPFTLTYRHNPYRWGAAVTKFYLLKNDEESKLGSSPLPNGFYTVFREAAAGGLAYLGRHTDRYIPVGEDLELNLGSDGLILLEDRRTEFRRVRLSYSSSGDVNGWDTEEEWTIVLRNSKREPVPVEVTRRWGGDFEFAASRQQPGGGSWTKKSATEYELKAMLPAMGESRFSYTITTRHGANARR